LLGGGYQLVSDPVRSYFAPGRSEPCALRAVLARMSEISSGDLEMLPRPVLLFGAVGRNKLTKPLITITHSMFFHRF